MKSYSEPINSTRLVRNLETCFTTGDVEYSGTALEILEAGDNELFTLLWMRMESAKCSSLLRSTIVAYHLMNLNVC
jgi:hypothetical protein